MTIETVLERLDTDFINTLENGDDLSGYNEELNFLYQFADNMREIINQIPFKEARKVDYRNQKIKLTFDCYKLEIINTVVRDEEIQFKIEGETSEK